MKNIVVTIFIEVCGNKLFVNGEFDIRISNGSREDFKNALFTKALEVIDGAVKDRMKREMVRYGHNVKVTVRVDWNEHTSFDSSETYVGSHAKACFRNYFNDKVSEMIEDRVTWMKIGKNKSAAKIA